MINIATRDSFHFMPGIFTQDQEGLWMGLKDLQRAERGEAFGQDQERHLDRIKRAGF